MKNSILKKMAGILLVPTFIACNSNTNDNAATDSVETEMSASEASYVNLSTGEPVTIIRSPKKTNTYTAIRNSPSKEIYFS